MADRRQVGVCYYNGCNPQYNRMALVGRIDGFFPETEFVTVQAGVKHPAILVVYGCPSRCTSVNDLAVPAGQLIYLNRWGELLPARERLAEALKEQQARSLTHKEILGTLPHQEPVLFVDTVGHLVPGKGAVISSRTQPELPCFADHLPGTPVLPDVCTIEAVAQAMDTLMVTTERYIGTLPLFVRVQEATLRQEILPGDILEIHVSLLEEKAERAIAACQERAFMGGVLAADLELRLVFR